MDFETGMGTCEALFAKNVIIEKYLVMNEEMNVGLIDYGYDGGETREID